MPPPSLIDTDVLVDYLRGRQKAVRFLEGLPGAMLLSVISIAELHAGVRGSEEEKTLSRFLQAFEAVPVTSAIARLGGAIRREYGPSHGTGLADALIAATAQEIEAILYTQNVRHFPMLRDTRRPYR